MCGQQHAAVGGKIPPRHEGHMPSIVRTTWSHGRVRVPKKGVSPMPSPPEGDHRKFWRKVTDVVTQCLAREALVIVLREVWRQGPW
jgi:hypothetical protein